MLDIDDNDGVGVDEFVDGCFRLKGPARSIDVHMLLLQVEKMITKVAYTKILQKDAKRYQLHTKSCKPYVKSC